MNIKKALKKLIVASIVVGSMTFMSVTDAKTIKPYDVEYMPVPFTHSIVDEYDVPTIGECNKAIAANPKSPKAYCNRGYAYLRSKEFVKAIDDFTRVIEFDEHFTDAYIGRATAYSELEDVRLATNDYNTAEEFDPKNPKIYIAKGLGELYGKGFFSHSHGGEPNLFSAGGNFERAIELNPNVPAEIYYARGVCKSDWDQAMRYFNKALELKPDYWEIYYKLGMNESRGKNYTKITPSGVQSVKEDSHFENAINYFTKVIEINPKFKETYYYRGMLYMLLGDKMVEFGRQGLDAKNMMQLKKDYEVSQLYKNALSDLTKAIKLDSKNIDAYYVRGQVYRELEDYKNAIEDFNKVIKDSPNAYNAYYSRGLCYKALNQEKEAQADFAKAKELGKS